MIVEWVVFILKSINFLFCENDNLLFLIKCFEFIVIRKMYKRMLSVYYGLSVFFIVLKLLFNNFSVVYWIVFVRENLYLIYLLGYVLCKNREVVVKV